MPLKWNKEIVILYTKSFFLAGFFLRILPEGNPCCFRCEAVFLHPPLCKIMHSGVFSNVIVLIGHQKSQLLCAATPFVKDFSDHQKIWCAHTPKHICPCYQVMPLGHNWPINCRMITSLVHLPNVREASHEQAFLVGCNKVKNFSPRANWTRKKGHCKRNMTVWLTTCNILICTANKTNSIEWK